MAYNNDMANRVRESLGGVVEKNMFGSLGFMVNGKLVVCVRDTNIMFKLDPETCEALIQQGMAERVVMGTKETKNWIYVANDALDEEGRFEDLLSTAVALTV